MGGGGLPKQSRRLKETLPPTLRGNTSFLYRDMGMGTAPRSTNRKNQSDDTSNMSFLTYKFPEANGSCLDAANEFCQVKVQIGILLSPRSQFYIY